MIDAPLELRNPARRGARPWDVSGGPVRVAPGPAETVTKKLLLSERFLGS